MYNYTDDNTVTCFSIQYQILSKCPTKYTEADNILLTLLKIYL